MTFDREPVKSKVADLTPRSRRVNIVVKVVSKNPVRDVVSRRDGTPHRVTEVLVGDETGVVLLTLWNDDIEKVGEEDVLNISNGYITLFRGSMRLNVGRYGTLEISEDTVDTVDNENNMSEKFFEDDRRRFGGFRRSPAGRGFD